MILPMPRFRAPGPLLVAVSTLALAALLYPGALLRGEAFFERDLHLDWYPRLAALGRVLREGSWPLWEPGLGFGQPLLADPSVQVLYPTTWLALLLPWGTSYTAFVLAHLFVAFLGTTRLAARFGAGRTGSWVAGLAFVLSGPVQSALNLWHHFAGTAWMPWVLLATDAVARRPSVRATLALAVTLALQVLAGSADVCAMTLALAIVLATTRLLARRRRATAAAVASCLAALALAAALTCALWWPAADVLSRSARRELPQDVRSAWSLPAAGLARLVVALDPARVPFEPRRWTSLYDRPSQPLLYSLYLGLPVLALALLALVNRARATRATALAGVAVLAVAFAMGPHAVLYGPLAEIVPWLRVFRYPSKAMLAAALAIALLAGLGARALAGAARGRLAVALFLILGSAGTVLVARRFEAAPTWSPLVGMVFALVLARQRVHQTASLARVSLVTLTAVDLVAAHVDLNATAPTALLSTPPAVVAEALRDDGRRVHVWDYLRPPGTSERLLGRADPYRPATWPPSLDHRVVEFAAQRQLLVAATATFFGLETSFDFDNRGLYPRDLNDIAYFLVRTEGTPVHLRLLQLGAVARVIALHDRGFEGLRLERMLPSLTGDPIRVFSVPEPRPRAWLVNRARVADGAAAIGALLDPAFDPREEAIVATPASFEPSSLVAGSVRWLGRRADRQQLETDSPRPALLVLADAYDPGWKASVDGAPVALLRANLAFRAVPVPEGRHRVELVYRPRPVLGGLAVSGSAVVACLGLIVAARSRLRRATAHKPLASAAREPRHHD